MRPATLPLLLALSCVSPPGGGWGDAIPQSAEERDGSRLKRVFVRADDGTVARTPQTGFYDLELRQMCVFSVVQIDGYSYCVPSGQAFPLTDADRAKYVRAVLRP